MTEMFEQTPGCKHALPCLQCRTRNPDFECSCEDACSWEGCPTPGHLRDAVGYLNVPLPQFLPVEDKS